MNRRYWKTHGLSGTRLYVCWTNMVQRCTNPRSTRWKDYGGRGIKVCERWRQSFEAFRADMAGYEDHLTIERIDVNGDYEPGNCRWATRSDQNRNKRRYHRTPKHSFEFNGKLQSIRAWSRELNLPFETLWREVVTNETPPDIAIAICRRRGRPKNGPPISIPLDTLLELGRRVRAEGRRIFWADLQKCILEL